MTDAGTLARLEKALLDAENRDPEALREILAPAPAFHTPPHNLVGGDHLGQEQAIRFIRDMREMTDGTLRVNGKTPPRTMGSIASMTLHVTATRRGRTLDGDTRIRMRLEEGRVAELWLEPLDGMVWDAFWAP